MRSESKVEEMLGCLWWVLGFLALQNEYPIDAIIFFIKGSLDHLTSIVFAVKESQKEKGGRNG